MCDSLSLYMQYKSMIPSFTGYGLHACTTSLCTVGKNSKNIAIWAPFPNFACQCLLLTCDPTKHTAACRKVLRTPHKWPHHVISSSKIVL